MLRKVPQVLQDVYGRRLRASAVRVGDWPAYLRWLQFYLNFCDKYRLRTTMIYTHTVPSRTLKETSSPLDFPPESFVAPPPHAGTPA